MAASIRNWLMEQMNASDSLDAVAMTIKLAVTEFGPQKVAKNLRNLTDMLEQHGSLPGWDFPQEKECGQGFAPGQGGGKASGGQALAGKQVVAYKKELTLKASKARKSPPRLSGTL